MAAGLPKYVTVNLSELEGAFEDGATVDLQAVQDKKLLNISGRETKLALKVRGRWRRGTARACLHVSTRDAGPTAWAVSTLAPRRPTHAHLHAHTRARTETHRCWARAASARS